MKILLIQIDPFGDVFISSALADVLKKHDPAYEIHYCCRQGFHKTLRNHPALAKLHLIKHTSGAKSLLPVLKLLFQLRKERFDVAIDIQNKPYTAFLACLSAKKSIGWANSRLKFLFSDLAQRKCFSYHALRRLDLLAPLGIQTDKFNYYLDIDAGSQKRMYSWLEEQTLLNGHFILCSPVSPIAFKQWNLKLYAQVLDKIISEKKLPVVLLWGPGEKSTVEEVTGYMQEKAIIAPPTDFFEAGALMQRAALLLCNDGGINHISAATGVKTLAVFGSTSPDAWSPAPVFHTHHHIYKAGSKASADNSFGLSAQDVFEKMTELLTKKL
ncbi:MAG: glycosyltransferase family 9 protein [Candidatus Cloacimonetes bacterium]|nr:glycosyltransferase family 9 protein [Candidatus Cloacimonadota bacterium]